MTQEEILAEIFTDYYGYTYHRLTASDNLPEHEPNETEETIR